MSAFNTLLFLLKQQAGLQEYISLLTNQSIANILQMLPLTKQFLQLVLVLSNYQFTLIVHKMSVELANLEDSLKNNGYQKAKHIHKSIIEDPTCFLLMCKIGFRAIENGCCSIFLSWLFQKLLVSWLERQVSSNIHFSTKIVQVGNISQIQNCSSVAYLLYRLYFDKRLIHMQQIQVKSSFSMPYAIKIGQALKSIEGKKLISNYITKQILATVLQNDSSTMSMYICYYIYDLLPLLAVSSDNRIIKNQQLKNSILQKSQQYLKIYTELSEKNSQQFISSSKSENQTKSKPKHMLVEEHKGFQLNKENKIKQIQMFLNDPSSVQSFKPRPKYIQPAFRPQFSCREHHKIVSPPMKQKTDDLEKMSKKAMKLWFKAKLAINEKKQNYMNRDKWIDDLHKLQSQCEGSERDKQRMINSNDLLSKAVSIITNGAILKLSPENENFLLKNCLNWMMKKIQAKTKKDKKLVRAQGPVNKSQRSENRYLIKKFQTTVVIISILEQIEFKLRSPHHKNIIPLCYMLKLANFAYQLAPHPIPIQIDEKIVLKIVSIMEMLIQYYNLHRFLLQQLQSTKMLDSWEVMNSWNPINLIAQFIQIFIRIRAKLTAGQFEDISTIFIKARIRLEKEQEAKDNKLNLSNVFMLLNQISQHDFKTAELRLYEEEQLYKNLASYS